MDNNYHIPQYLDEPERFFFFTTDEAILVLLLVGLGILTGYFMGGFLLSLLLLWLYKKYIGKEGKSYLLYLKYWFLPSSFSHLKYTPASHKRHYLS